MSSTYHHQPKRLITYSHMANTIDSVIAPWCRENDVTRIYGVPRKGMVAAGMLANTLECRLAAFDPSGPSHLGNGTTHLCQDLGRASLLLDEGTFTGGQLDALCKPFAESFNENHQVYCGAVFQATAPHVLSTPNLQLDIVGCVIDTQRDICEWDWWQHADTKHYMLDFDGILCPDRDEKILDQSQEYITWCQQVLPKRALPNGIHSICTWREEYMRSTCEWWLQTHGINTGMLLMSVRQNWSSPEAFKVRRYLDSDARLFIESCPVQAREMRKLILHAVSRTELADKKPVMCLQDGTLQ